MLSILVSFETECGSYHSGISGLLESECGVYNIRHNYVKYNVLD